MDVTAVLGSLYPAVTAILAWLFTKEHMACLQMLGVGIAVLAMVMITIRNFERKATDAPIFVRLIRGHEGISSHSARDKEKPYV